YLSQSGRGGPAIADEANRWLSQIDTPLRLTGNPAIASELVDLDAPKAVLCRTNAEAMKRVMDLLAADRRVALAGGGADIRRLAQAAADLKSGRRTSHPELYVFATWGALQE
ncbi:DNA helicase, partial [Mycobacterium timonense]